MTSDPSIIKGTAGVRGISYPALSLEEAVRRATQLWQHERKNAAPMEAVASHWGYSPSSSGVRTTVAALISFGLVADQGSREARQVQLTPRGLDIVLETPERNAALCEAVLSPKIYAEILANWPVNNFPSDQTLKVYLLRHKNFNPKAVDGFIKDFRDSISFSGLAKAGNMPQVTAIEDEAIPDMQPQLGERSLGIRSVERAAPSAVQALSTGERNWFEIPLSEEVKCRVILTGADIDEHDIDTLIEFLEFQKRRTKRKSQPLTIDQTPEAQEKK
jgi:hypothetical protein